MESRWDSALGIYAASTRDIQGRAEEFDAFRGADGEAA